MTYKFLINGVQVEEPIGWDGFEYLLQRSDEYTGLENIFSIDVLEFDGIGADLIKAEFEANGFDGSLNYTVQTICEDGTIGDQLNAVINLVTYSEINGHISVHIEESGFHRKFVNRVESIVNFDSTKSIGGVDIGYPELFDLGLHSKEITKSSLFKFSDPDNSHDSDVPSGWTFDSLDTDSPTIVSSTSSDHRTIQQSYSQDILPEVEVYSEILDHPSDTMSLIRSDTYPADNAQLQGSSLIITRNTLSEIYTISGKLKFGLYSTISPTALTEDFQNGLTYQQTLTVKLYVQFGTNTPQLIEAKDPITYNGTFNNDGTESTFVGFPFNEFTFDFATIADARLTQSLTGMQPIKVYIKIDSERVIQRLDYSLTIPPPQYKLDINFFSYFKKSYATNVDSFISASENSKADASSAKSILIFDAFKRVCESITDTTDCFKSDFFSINCGRWTAVTNGKNIRQMRQKDNTTFFPIVTNFKDLFSSADAIWNLGMRIEKDETGKYFIRVEEKSYFYSGDSIISLENVADIEKTVAPELIYNEVEIGYDKWNLNVGQSNGIDEFNSIHNYSLPIVNIKKKYQAKSKFITSGYIIEETRRKQWKDNPTADFETDDDNFFICTNTDVQESTLYTVPASVQVYQPGTISERAENFSTVANVLSPTTVYNLRISPVRMILNHYPLLAAGLDKKVNPIVKFVSAQGNFSEMDELNDECDQAVGLVKQNQNILNTDPVDNIAYYRPYYLVFDYPLTFQQFINIRENSIKAIDFSCGSEQILGYIKEIKFEPNGENGGIASFKLLEALCRLGGFDEGFDNGFDIGTC